MARDEVTNSYMLPHGGREAATPRSTTPSTWLAAATTVIAIPTRPSRSTRLPPGPSSAEPARAAAHSAACAVIATR